MASYNYEKYLPETIESVLDQSFTDIEFIIVDDASKDNSREIIKSYQEKDDRVHAVYHGENRGIAKTFNDGIDEATGEFVAIVGCDDLWVKNKLEKQIEVLKRDEDLVVHTGVATIDAQGNVIEESEREHSGKKRNKNGHIFRELLEGNFVCGSSIIFKKSNLNGIKLDERYRYVNDYKFTLDLAREYEFHYIAEPLVKYRVHGGNITLRDKGGWLKDFAAFGKELLREYENEFSSRAKARFLFKIALDAYNRAAMTEARRYSLKAIRTRPFMAKYWKLLVSSICAKSRTRNESAA
jgi:glycosyltransferase involved in cell wall biosynthesis